MRYDSAAYFREMDIPSTLVQAMQSTDPKRMRVLGEGAGAVPAEPATPR